MSNITKFPCEEFVSSSNSSKRIVSSEDEDSIEISFPKFTVNKLIFTVQHNRFIIEIAAAPLAFRRSLLERILKVKKIA